MLLRLDFSPLLIPWELLFTYAKGKCVVNRGLLWIGTLRCDLWKIFLCCGLISVFLDQVRGGNFIRAIMCFGKHLELVLGTVQYGSERFWRTVSFWSLHKRIGQKGFGSKGSVAEEVGPKGSARRNCFLPMAEHYDELDELDRPLQCTCSSCSTDDNISHTREELSNLKAANCPYSKDWFWAELFFSTERTTNVVRSKLGFERVPVAVLGRIRGLMLISVKLQFLGFKLVEPCNKAVQR